MNKEQQLYRAIVRSEEAFKVYSNDRLYHQALHIYKSNLIVYQILEQFSLECSEDILVEVFNYIFHLEDWFAQFKELEKSNPALEKQFVFNRLKNSISYPSTFKNLIHNKL